MALNHPVPFVFVFSFRIRYQNKRLAEPMLRRVLFAVLHKSTNDRQDGNVFNSRFGTCFCRCCKRVRFIDDLAVQRLYLIASGRQLVGENLLDGGPVRNHVSVEQDVDRRCVVEFGYGGFVP